MVNFYQVLIVLFVLDTEIV